MFLGKLVGVKMKQLLPSLMVLLILISNQVQADISESVRSDKAVVRYEFNEASGETYLDSAHTKYGAALDLINKTPGNISRGTDGNGDKYISIDTKSVIRSSAVASKIYNTCNQATSTGLTIEVVVENNESVQLRSGEFPENIPQPLRIVSYSRDFSNRVVRVNNVNTNVINVNFSLGQFYDMGNLYLGAVTTGANNNLFSDPLMSSTSAIMLQGVSRPASSYKQSIVFTVSKAGIARLFLSDRNGNIYQATETNQGFGGTAAQFTSRWASDAYLNVANDFIADANIASTFSRNDQFANGTCVGTCADNPNRFWKGKMYRLAVYCDALSKEQIFGNAYAINRNEIVPLSNVQITPQLLKAAEIYNRLTGVKTPIYNPILQQIALKLDGNDPVGAAALVTEHSLFYNLTVKNFAARMSNRDETINVPLNDFTATIIGATRDNLNAKTLLYDNFYYQADPTKAAVPSDEIDDILKSNNHYESLDRGDFDLKSVLIKKTPQLLFDGNNAVSNPTPSGLLTTRQWAAAHFIAGTNRRAVEFSLREFTCTPIENAADSSGPEDVIGRDIDRNPGGSMSKFATSCRACHTVMDGFRPAFAFMTFSNNFLKHSLLVPNSTANNLNEDNSNAIGVHVDAPKVARKFNRNETTFPGGKIVKDDIWVNNANSGTNKTNFGWTRTNGQGITDFGKAIAESKAFPKCMAKRVFFTVCKREATAKDDAFLTKVADEFSSPERNYNLKFLFQKIVTNDSCLGGG